MLLNSLEKNFQLFGLRYWRISEQTITTPSWNIHQYEIKFQDNKYEDREIWSLLTRPDWDYVLLIRCENGLEFTTETLSIHDKSQDIFSRIYEQIKDYRDNKPLS